MIFDLGWVKTGAFERSTDMFGWILGGHAVTACLPEQLRKRD